MVYGEYIQSPQVQLAKALADSLPKMLDNVYLLNSGSEAVEGAIKLAKRFTGRPKVISCYNAYHGSSHGALSVSGSEVFKEKFRPLLPGVSHFSYGSFSDLEKIDDQTAAVIVETVQGEAGVVYSCQNWFHQLRERCDEKGTLLILDEIQCGFGRTGTLWAFEQFDVVPDILLSAKGMGGGMPISCFISTSEIMGVLKENPVLGHITTFGGHPVSSAAALATIRTIQNGLLKDVTEKADTFKSRLKHKKIKQFRQIGLMMALEFESFDEVKPIIDNAIELGVITDWILFNDKSMRIAPPLTITKNEIHEACDVLMKAISA